MQPQVRRLLVFLVALPLVLTAPLLQPERAVACGLGCTDTCLEQSQGEQLCENVCDESGYFCDEDGPCPGEKVAHDCFPEP